MKNKIILIGTFLLFPFFALAQIDYDIPINQYNANGQKEGFWREDRKVDFLELYYKNGERSGVFRCLSIKGRLRILGEYKEGNETGTWYFFNDKGFLEFIQKDFGPNTLPITLSDGKEVVLPYRCYNISYYPNGVIESEGILLWEMSSESDFTWEYGEWKYYDETGKLIKTKVFK